MSIQYRAVWSDPLDSDATANVDRLKAIVGEWTHEGTEAEPLQDGASEFQVSHGRHRHFLMRTINPHAFEVTVTDRVSGDSTEWMTVIRVVADETNLHTLVELSMSSEDIATRITVARPKVVHDFLKGAKKPVLAGSGLLTEPLELPANGIQILTDKLADPSRSLPIIVCAEPAGSHDVSWLKNARSIAARSEGVAVVITLDASAVAAFRREFGQLAIWDGGVRVYAPGVVTPDSEGWKHRYYTRARLEASTQSVVNRIVYSVAQLSTRRRIPPIFSVFGTQGGLPADALDGMIPLEVLTQERETWAYQTELARDEQSSLERELATSNGHLARLKDELITRRMFDLLWGTMHESTDSIPDVVQDVSEAVIAAQAYLSEWLALPESAVQELDDVDTAPEAYNWGNKTWRGLQALAAYAKDRANGWDKGGFWEWCASGPPLGWPATPKKLAMTESETVQNSDKLRRTRVLSIDREVEASGEILMLAHLKIAEGGGNLAPRVYFHDDTNGSTRMVHIGLVGPHHLVPNKSAN